MKHWPKNRVIKNKLQFNSICNTSALKFNGNGRKRRNKREKFQYRKKFGFHHQKLEMLRQMQLFATTCKVRVRGVLKRMIIYHKFLSAFEPFSSICAKKYCKKTLKIASQGCKKNNIELSRRAEKKMKLIDRRSAGRDALKWFTEAEALFFETLSIKLRTNQARNGRIRTQLMNRFFLVITSARLNLLAH